MTTNINIFIINQTRRPCGSPLIISPGFMGDTNFMAQLNGLISKMNGSAGQFTFKRQRGKTIVSEKAVNTSNTRTAAQQRNRMKWANVIKNYSGINPLLHCAFENKPQYLSDYNMFVKCNLPISRVYLTKSESAANACVAAPYILTQGSLDSIQLTGLPGLTVTDISLGQIDIDDATTVGDFSTAVVLNNSDYNFGDQISFILVKQSIDATTGHPHCKFYGECIVLEKSSDVLLRDLVSAAGFSSTNGYLCCQLPDEFQGAYAWVHSRKTEGVTKVSSQVFTIKNDLYADYTTEVAYQRAVATYGGESDVFLTPMLATAGNTVADAPSDSSGSGSGSIQKKSITLSASPAEGGTVSGSGSYTLGSTATLTASPASGYTFTRWSDGNTANPRTLTVSSDLTLQAIFTSTQSGGSSESEGGGDTDDEDMGM